MCSRSLIDGRGPLLRYQLMARQPDPKDAPLARLALDVEQPAVGAHQPERDRQAEPEAPWLGLLRIRCSEEALEDAVLDLSRDADAGVGNAEPGVRVVLATPG